MTAGIMTAVYPAPPVDKREVLRYAGAKTLDKATALLLDECIALAKDAFSYRVAYAVYPILQTENGLSLGFFETASQDLCKNLSGCERAVALCATVGQGIDRLVLKESLVSPARSLLLDALGTERVEALVDVFCAELARKYAREGCALHPRFSPGYGDLPLSVQKPLFSALDLPRKIGVSLNDSLLMTPKKSVTAFVGIQKAKELL